MPLMKHERGKAADAAAKPESQCPCKTGVLQLRGRQLPVAGRRGRVCLSAAYFLFAALQMVSRRCTSRRQAPVCGADEHRGQETVYRVRRVLCVQL